MNIISFIKSLMPDQEQAADTTVIDPTSGQNPSGARMVTPTVVERSDGSTITTY
jgi:hypothetical protein